MLVNIHHDNAREHHRLLVAGIAFVVSIALLIWLSIAIYNKEFERVTMVTVKADRAGLQLAKFGDVRVNGALVGQVREVTQDGEQAEIHIALQPSVLRGTVVVDVDQHGYPVIRTVVVEPQIAKLRKKSATTTVTMLVRMARPTAIPTPAGPPEAVKP